MSETSLKTPFARVERRIRALVAKPGLNSHDRGAKIVARALRDAGMEVVYTGLRQTPEQIVETAMQEDIDVLCLSILSGAHMTLLPRIMNLMREKDLDDVLVIAGGIVPEEDIPKLKQIGIAEVFGPGTPTHITVNYVRNNLKRKS